MKKFLNMRHLKEVLIAKGERIGLVVCAVLGVFLLAFGVVSGFQNSPRRWWDEVAANTADVKVQISKGTSEQWETPKIPPYVWVSDEPPSPWDVPPIINIDEKDRNPRRQPVVYPVAPPDQGGARYYPSLYGLTAVNQAENVQVDLVMAGIQGYEINCEKKTYVEMVPEGKKRGAIAEVLKPRRLVVVSIVYD